MIPPSNDLYMSRFRPRAVLFDMDNTLHDLRGARFAAADALMAYYGVFGDLHFYSLNRNPPTLIEDAVSAYIADGVPADPEVCAWLYHTLEHACISSFDGITDVLDALKKDGVKLAVISNADPEDTEKRLANLHLRPYFNAVITPDTFGIKKPNPLVFKKTLNLLGVSAEETAMIGDKKDRDVFPPRELGIFAIHALYGTLEKPDRECMVSKPLEILELLAVTRD
ncbi:MAG TPA: HAD family hydrolase [Methanocorpusculum sp.]|nr:HAD family hydrolase [Methanocorpusculum sp.]